MLDPVQQSRIEALHRGFLYQHLFGVGCLLLAGSVNARRIFVERDEDIEVDFAGSMIYVQVKTRNQALAVDDVASALDRFTAIRRDHLSGGRAGHPRFLIVANKPPNSRLRTRLAQELDDVGYSWPGGHIGPAFPELPPAWPDVAAARDWCVAQADRLPYRMIASDSLVWKLTGQVALAASGGAPFADHAFSVDALPDIFEQLLLQLQDFPEPPAMYRPHTGEPQIGSPARVRIICGFSGAGKTSWAAQGAVHAGEPCAYYDAAETAGPALAAALVRELAGRLFQGQGDDVRRVLMPGASPLESLRLLDRHLGTRGMSAVVVIDNAHAVPARNLVEVVRATAHLRFALLCQPGGSTAEIEALAGIAREDLRGWDVQEVSKEVVSQGCQGSAQTMQRLQALCAGLPLYVQGACRVASAEYGGDIDALCSSIEDGTHLTATPQELILQRVFELLSAAERTGLAVLSISEVALSKAEVEMLLHRFVGLSAQDAAALLRRLRTAGILQVFGSRDMRVHDAMRILGVQHLHHLGAEVLAEVRGTMKELVIRSLEERRDASRFGFLTRLLIALEDVEVLIDLMGEEMFHEMGVASEVTAALQTALDRGDLTPEQQFWAYDGLIFAGLREGPAERVPVWLQQMESVLDQNRFIGTHRLTFLLKTMLYQASLGDAAAVIRSIETIGQALPDSADYQLIFRYNASAALFKVGDYDASMRGADEVIRAYFERLGTSAEEVAGKSQRELWDSLDARARESEDVKHLADALELLALAQEKAGQRVGLARIHAMKFFALAGAYESLIRAGQDAADDFVRRREYQGAKEVMEQHVLPHVRELRMASKLLDASTQYAVILAYCGQIEDAEAQMARVEGLLPGASTEMQAQVATQKRLIEEVRRLGPPRQMRHVNVGQSLSRMLGLRGPSSVDRSNN